MKLGDKSYNSISLKTLISKLLSFIMLFFIDLFIIIKLPKRYFSMLKFKSDMSLVGHLILLLFINIASVIKYFPSEK